MTALNPKDRPCFEKLQNHPWLNIENWSAENLEAVLTELNNIDSMLAIDFARERQQVHAFQDYNLSAVRANPIEQFNISNFLEEKVSSFDSADLNMAVHR